MALAHQGSPNFLSQIDRLTPAVDGVSVSVLNRDDRLLLQNTSGEEAVEDDDVRTKVFDWQVPLEVGGRNVAIAGTLFWTPVASAGGVPLPAILIGAAVVIALCIAVVIKRRRRTGEPAEAW